MYCILNDKFRNLKCAKLQLIHDIRFSRMLNNINYLNNAFHYVQQNTLTIFERLNNYKITYKEALISYSCQSKNLSKILIAFNINLS